MSPARNPETGLISEAEIHPLSYIINIVYDII